MTTATKPCLCDLTHHIDRVVGARTLSTLLSDDAETTVTIGYDPRRDHYTVRWTDGPSVDRMQANAHEFADHVPGFCIHGLAWERHRTPGTSTR